MVSSALTQWELLQLLVVFFPHQQFPSTNLQHSNRKQTYYLVCYHQLYGTLGFVQSCWNCNVNFRHLRSNILINVIIHVNHGSDPEFHFVFTNALVMKKIILIDGVVRPLFPEPTQMGVLNLPSGNPQKKQRQNDSGIMVLDDISSNPTVPHITVHHQRHPLTSPHVTCRHSAPVHTPCHGSA